ncbi:hypothetical protein DFH09DRAFT_1175997 [Mycena vulgaris]|nr:hypothetical protein DFH09DRAFT_1175997 [Mycena vulgaris]
MLQSRIQIRIQNLESIATEDRTRPDQMFLVMMTVILAFNFFIPPIWAVLMVAAMVIAVSLRRRLNGRIKRLGGKIESIITNLDLIDAAGDPDLVEMRQELTLTRKSVSMIRVGNVFSRRLWNLSRAITRTEEDVEALSEKLLAQLAMCSCGRRFSVPRITKWYQRAGSQVARLLFLR